MTPPHLAIFQNIIFPGRGRRRHPLVFFPHRWTHIWIHSWMPSWYLANARYLRRHLGEDCTRLRLVERQYSSKMSQWLSFARCWMPVLKFLNKKSHGIRPLVGYCRGVSGIGFLDPRNGNKNHFPGIEKCIHNIWMETWMENSVTVLWDVQPKFFQYIYCQGTVEVSLALDTVRFPLIADRRSVIVPGVPFIFKRKIRKQLKRAHMKCT